MGSTVHCCQPGATVGDADTALRWEASAGTLRCLLLSEDDGPAAATAAGWREVERALGSPFCFGKTHLGREKKLLSTCFGTELQVYVDTSHMGRSSGFPAKVLLKEVHLCLGPAKVGGLWGCLAEGRVQGAK